MSFCLSLEPKAGRTVERASDERATRTWRFNSITIVSNSYCCSGSPSSAVARMAWPRRSAASASASAGITWGRRPPPLLALFEPERDQPVAHQLAGGVIVDGCQRVLLLFPFRSLPACRLFGESRPVHPPARSICQQTSLTKPSASARWTSERDIWPRKEGWTEGSGRMEVRRCACWSGLPQRHMFGYYWVRSSKRTGGSGRGSEKQRRSESAPHWQSDCALMTSRSRFRE